MRLDRWLDAPQPTFAAFKARAAAGEGPTNGAMERGIPGVDDPSAADRAALKYGRRWRSRACRMPLPPMLDAKWVSELLLCAKSSAIREEVVALLSTLADATPARALPFLDMLLALLPRACAAPGSTAAEYFGLLKRLMAPAERRLYLCARGLLGVLSEAIGAEARALRASEATGMVDMSHGCTLRTLVELLQARSSCRRRSRGSSGRRARCRRCSTRCSACAGW